MRWRQSEKSPLKIINETKSTYAMLLKSRRQLFMQGSEDSSKKMYKVLSFGIKEFHVKITAE